MNRKYILIVFAAVFGIFTACEKYLELEPSQSISEDVVLTTDRNVKNVLLGAYSLFNNEFIFGGRVLLYSELLGGDGEVFFSGTYPDIRQINQKQISVSNQDITQLWLRSYRTINVTNNVLSALEVVNDDSRARVEGEALFLRALMYFELVRMYGVPYDVDAPNNTGLGVPLVLTPTRGITEQNNVPRNTVQEVYNQIVDDLVKAANQLPASNSVYATRGAANALLARVYLQMGRYQEARDRANAVIPGYELRPSYAAVFNNNNPTTEDIFVNYITSQDRFSAMTEFFSVPEFGGRDGDVDVLQAHLNLYPDGDQRKNLFFRVDDDSPWRSGKWNNQYGVVHILRLAEMILIRAETNQRLGTSEGATPLADINRLRERAGAPLLETVTLADILLERRLELAHEGHRIHDIRRLKLNAGTRPYNANELVFPIPFREMEVNPNLVQNPGYN